MNRRLETTLALYRDALADVAADYEDAKRSGPGASSSVGRRAKRLSGPDIDTLFLWRFFSAIHVVRRI
jgi:hypothetical protein